MALKKSVPLVLLLFTVMCVLPAATTAAVIPSAFAQEEDDDMSLDEAENLASGTVSNVLDNGNTAGDDTEVSVPITDIDQTDANFGLSGALDVTVERTLSPQEEEEPPECAVEITADKEIYEPLDVVAITITNTGDVPLVFPTSLIGLEIRNVDTGEVLLLDALPAVTTLEPGESQTFRFEYEDLVREIGTGLISATVTSDCGTEEDTFRLLEAPID